ncbi:putative alcohol dehydrogenase [Xylaria castorea]|nr:putative alcohol dehydrogenase [Xylaria castorea]
MANCNDVPTQQFQSAIIQSDHDPDSATALPLSIAKNIDMPTLATAYDVLIQVLAVALNHCDYKMPTNFLVSGGLTGCDFCGLVVKTGASAVCEKGTRVCGGLFPYGRYSTASKPQGSFAEFIAVDSRRLLRIPDTWSDLEGAALGAVGWGTVGLALSDPHALALDGFPSTPTAEPEPVLVYGAATATGTIACQLLKLSGYLPVAVTSPQSAALAVEYGASSTCFYTSPTCAESVRALAGVPIRHALDCITSAESVATCFAALARTGGRYACLESLQDSWRTRRAVRVKEVMGYEGLGRDFQVSSETAPGTTYTRDASLTLAALYGRWTAEMQHLLDAGSIKHHPILQIEGQWNGIIKGVRMLQRGEVRGRKLVVRIAEVEGEASPLSQAPQ